VQLLLAEKRTSLSTFRTGIAIFALPISTFSVLVATSRYYDPTKVWGFLAVLIVLNVGLIGLGAYLIVHSLQRVRRFDKLIRQIKLEHSAIAKYLE
jgi:Na+/melibiose symporter-like transporter